MNVYMSGAKNLKMFTCCGQVHLKFYLSCCQITFGIQGNITLLSIFYLPFGHWMKIYACPDLNFTCPGLPDK